MNERKILAYHHQFDSMRIDGLQRLYEMDGSVVSDSRSTIMNSSGSQSYGRLRAVQTSIGTFAL